MPAGLRDYLSARSQANPPAIDAETDPPLERSLQLPSDADRTPPSVRTSPKRRQAVRLNETVAVLRQLYPDGRLPEASKAVSEVVHGRMKTKISIKTLQRAMKAHGQADSARA